MLGLGESNLHISLACHVIDNITTLGRDLCFADYLNRPELSSWKDSERATFVAVTDAQALEGFKMLSELEGISPALETAHAVWAAVELAKTMKKDQDLVICVSGRGYVYIPNASRALN